MEQVTYTDIRHLEHQIDKLKLLNKLGKLNHRIAKFEIKALEIELRIQVDKLPTYERRVYRIKKEFGREF
jgi:hypothetical protein